MDLQEIEKRLNALTEEVLRSKEYAVLQSSGTGETIIPMTLKEIETQLKELNEEVQKYKNKQQPPKYKRWRAERGKGYYQTIGVNGSIIEVLETGNSIDDFRYNSGNYHQTKEQATRYRDTQLLRQELKDFAEGYEFKYEGFNWGICLARSGEYTSKNEFVFKEDKQYFPTQEKGKEAIKHFGDRLDLIYKPQGRGMIWIR